ncbi:MAG: hypothetical protein ACYTEX_15575 [Planctomycetota bacterium]|jgi:hypothetical protein
MTTPNNIMLRALGLLLLVAAILKGAQLLTEPVAAGDPIQESRLARCAALFQPVLIRQSIQGPGRC